MMMFLERLHIDKYVNVYVIFALDMLTSFIASMLGLLGMWLVFPEGGQYPIEFLAEWFLSGIIGIGLFFYGLKTYYSVIHQKTAALFEACCGIGAISASADDRQIDAAKNFGRLLGIIFQIRDDIFDYYDSAEIGKPTGNDMAEGKLTLPVLYALQSTGNQEMLQLALKVRRRLVTA